MEEILRIFSLSSLIQLLLQSCELLPPMRNYVSWKDELLGWHCLSELAIALAYFALLILLIDWLLQKKIIRKTENSKQKINTEHAFKESEARFRQLVENIQEVFWMTEPNQEHLIYVSPAYEKIWGRSCKSLYNQPECLYDTLHPEDRDRVRAVFNQPGRPPYDLEYRIIRPDGTIRWIRDRSFQIRNERGEVYRICGLAQDISERQAALGDRKQAEERIAFQASLLNQVRHSVIAIDLEGKITYWNPFAEQMFQWQAEEVMGKYLFELVVPPEIQPIAEEITANMINSGYWEGEFTVCRRDGSTFPIYAVDTLLRDAKGNPIGYIGVSVDITERKKAEETLKQQKELLQTIFDHIPVMINFLDAEGQLKMVNREWERILGWSFDEIQDHDIMTQCFPHPEYRQAVSNHILTATGKWQDFKITVRDGRVLETSWTNIPLSDGTSISIGQDITERKRAEQALQESEQLWHSILENMPVMLDAYNENNRIVVWNQECERVTGYTADEIVDNPAAMSLIYPDAAYLQELMAQWHERGNYFRNWELELTTKDNQKKTVSWSNLSAQFPIPGWTGWAIGVDVTERKQAEEALKSSEARFRKIFAHAPIGMALIEPDGKLFQINQALCQMLGYSETDLKELNYSHINHPEDWEIELSYIQQICSGEIAKYQLEKRYFNSNGDVVWAKVTCGLLCDLDSKVFYRLAMIENITERRLIEQMKDSFISIVSHELRTPITSIYGVLGLLASQQLGILVEEGYELVNIALSESQRLIRLIGDILDLERMRSGHITLFQEVCQVSDLTLQAVNSIKPIAKKTGINIVVSSTQETVWVDPDRMLQLLTNLLDNAIKFSPPNGTVWLSVQRIGGEQFFGNELHGSITPQILFAIRDQGRGIPTNKLETIFEPFEQVDTGDTRGKGGTGLGLAICRSIVLAHGGKIWAESVVSEGSTFYFTLPLPPEE